VPDRSLVITFAITFGEQVGGKPVSVFTELEETLDANVGKILTFTVVRGGKLLDYEIKVDDLHAITPKSYLEVGDCVLNDLSYHSAKAHHLPVGGVYVAKAGCVSALFSTCLQLVFDARQERFDCVSSSTRHCFAPRCLLPPFRWS
jgi:hypothetical protein